MLPPWTAHLRPDGSARTAINWSTPAPPGSPDRREEGSHAPLHDRVLLHGRSVGRGIEGTNTRSAMGRVRHRGARWPLEGLEDFFRRALTLTGGRT